MLPTLLLACAGHPTWGTWMFTREVTVATGDECTQSVSHDFTGATEPAEAAGDTGWVEESTEEVSPEVSFGRLEQDGDGAVLILGTDVLPGTEQDDGSWLFYWTHTDSGEQQDTHASGYDYTYTYDSSSTLRVAGTFDGDHFTGTHETETSSTGTWTESDTWSEEAAAYVGEHGEIPSDQYLVLTDQAGTETAVRNTRDVTDCSSTACTLAVTASCAYRYTLTGVATDFDGQDAPWTEDAGEAAGE